MIDANGVRYHLILGEADWLRCRSAGAPADDEPPAWRFDPVGQVVTLAPQLFTFPGAHGGEPLDPARDRRGAARDRYGHWYWIGQDRASIFVRWRQGRQGERYWPPTGPAACVPPPTGPFAPSQPRTAETAAPLAGLAVTTGHYLAAGLAGALLVFDLHTGGQPARVLLPPAAPAEPTAPFDLAPLPDGGLAVLDRDHRLVWLLDSALRVQRAEPPVAGAPLLFQPKAGDPAAPTTAPAERLPAPLRLDATIDPIAVEALPNGDLLVLDRREPGLSTLHRYRPGVAGPVASVALREESLRAAEEPVLALPAIDGHDLAFVPAPAGVLELGTLYIAAASGHQVYGLSLLAGEGLALRAHRRYYPLRNAGGRALVAPPGSVYAYFDQGRSDPETRWLPVAALPHSRYAGEAVLELPIFDGKTPGCIWHRLCLDACIPPGTAIEVESRAADSPALLAQAPWQPEPPPYLRPGPESSTGDLWSPAERHRDHTGAWELLFQAAQGRYLALRLTLRGDRRTTPALRALRAHYPRFSYLREYLPAVYQADPTSAHFLDRFLANPEGILTTLEGMIAQVERLFDVRSAPAEALAWLGSWLGLAFDPGWSDYQRRLLIAHAPYFFLRRGTLPGIRQAILLALHPEAGPAIFQDEAAVCPTVRVVERFRTRGGLGVAAGDPTAAGEDAGAAGDAMHDELSTRAHRFTV
ncbi:MAG TPA: phage tail protein, partial [Caldilineaceae bacterium]|nr:phage tail protein [Caldilineaceae bacterium]